MLLHTARRECVTRFLCAQLDKPVDKLWVNGAFRGRACAGKLRAKWLTRCATGDPRETRYGVRMAEPALQSLVPALSVARTNHA